MAQTDWPLRDKTAVVGIGYGVFGRSSGYTQMQQNQIAFANALADSGLKPSDIDGLLVHSGPTQCDQLPEFLGLNVRWSGQVWPHGRMAAVALQEAAMVVNAGMANYVAVFSSNVNRKMITGERAENDEAYRPGGGPHAEYPPYGMVHPGCLAAMSFGKYVDKYGGDPDNLGWVAVNQRKNAELNPNAVYRTPITFEDYKQSRRIIEPLRLFDFTVNTDGAVCLIVTRADRAKDCRNTPVLISGMQGLSSGSEFATLSMIGGGASRQSEFDYSVAKYPQYTRTAYDMAGVSREDVKAYNMYDSFSPMTLFTIEEWGLCRPGEGLAFLAETDTTVRGTVPINTGGGHLSSGMMSGANVLAEAIQQARGDCGERQVKDCDISQYVHTAFLTCIFKRGEH